jgi:non-heme chloroperoxidase
VLFHGWPLRGQSWEKQVPALIGAGYRVITYDRRGFGESSRCRRLRRHPRRAERRPRGLSLRLFQNFYNADVLRGTRLSDEVLRLSWTIAAGASPKGTHDLVAAWGTDFRADLGRITVPTLIVHGDADRIVPLEASGQRMPALIKGSRLAVVKGSPHGLNWTHAEELNQALLEFLRAR